MQEIKPVVTQEKQFRSRIESISIANFGRFGLLEFQTKDRNTPLLNWILLHKWMVFDSDFDGRNDDKVTEK